MSRTSGSRAALFLLSLGVWAGCTPRVQEQRFQLANGLAVDVVASPRGAKVAVALLFALGLDHDPAGQSGLNHLVEHLFLTAGVKGVKPRTRAEVDQRYPLGWSSQTGSDFTAIVVTVEADQLGDELDGLAARLSGLAPDEADLARERPSLLEEVGRMRGGDPEQGAINFAAEAVAASRGEGWRGGVAKEIDALTAADVAAFVAAHHKPASARLVVAGRVDVEKMKRRIEAAFGSVPEGTAAAVRPAATSRVTGTLVMGDAPSAAALAVGAPGPSQPLYPAFLLLAARLMGADKPGGWKGSFDPLQRPEAFFATTSLKGTERPDDAAKRLLHAVGAEISSSAPAPSAKQARDTFGAQLGLQPMTPEQLERDPAGVALCRARTAQLDIDGKALQLKLDAVTAAQLSEAAGLFDPKRTAVVVAGGKVP